MLGRRRRCESGLGNERQAGMPVLRLRRLEVMQLGPSGGRQMLREPTAR